MMNSPPESGDNEGEQPLSAPRIPSAQEQLYINKGILVKALSTGFLGRPIVSADRSEELGFGKRQYFALTKEHQEALGLENPSDAVIVVVAEDGQPSLYLGVGMLPDNDYEVPGKDGMQLGFVSRATQGLFADYGIRNREDAEAIVRDYPRDENTTIATPNFNQALGGSSVQFGVIDTEAMKDRHVSVNLPVKPIDGGYPPRLLEKWKGIVKENVPLLVVPNAVAKLLGLSMTSTKNQPGSLGNTIADGGYCNVQLPGQTESTRMYVVGALDGIGVPKELASDFSESQYEVAIQVGGKKLIFKEIKTE